MKEHEEMKDVIRMVAEKNGVSEEEVRSEMEKAIHEAYLLKSPGFIKAFGDREPSVEEFIEQTVMDVMRLS